MGRVHQQPALGLFVWAVMCTPLSAQTSDSRLDLQKAALKEIRDTAADMCQTAPIDASGSSVELSLDAKAKLDGVLRKVADLGVEGAAKYNDTKSKGVLQKDLASAIEKGNNCKLDVFNALLPRMLDK